MKLFSTQLLLPLFCSQLIFGQQLTHSDERIEEYKKQLKETNLVLPNDVSLTKKQSILLEKMHRERIDAQIHLLGSRNILLDGAIYEFTDRVFQKIKSANPIIPATTKLVVYRSSQFNAFTMGEEFIFVNLGLLCDLSSEAEIALVIGHELAHNVYKHPEQSMLETVLLKTDAELNDKISEARKSDYGNVSALNKLLTPKLFESRERSRNCELQADSMGVVFMQNAGYDLKDALGMFEAMKHHQENRGPFVPFNLVNPTAASIFDVKINSYQGEGSLGSFEEDDELEPYLRTHPYSDERIVEIKKNFGATLLQNKEVTSEFAKLKNEVRTELIYSTIFSKNLTKAIYYGVLNELNGFDSKENDMHLALCYASLGYLKTKRKSGSYLSLQDPKQDESFDQLCHLLYSLNPTECLEISAAYKNSKPGTNETSLEFILIELLADAQNENYDHFEQLWKSHEKEIRKSSYVTILEEMEVYLLTKRRMSFINQKSK